MKKVTQILISLLITVITLTGCSIVETSEEKQKTAELISKAKSAKYLVVDIHHDHCEPCKIIKPIIEKLETKYADNPEIVFLKYDLSNPFKSMRSMKTAKELGLENIYKAQRYTGVVLFIDGSSKEVTETLVADPEEENYVNLIESKLVKKDSGT